MQHYGVSDVERMLNLSRSTIRGLISRGFVAPSRGPRREYRFSFQDLLVLRTARALVKAKVPPRRIGRSLTALRRQLPQSVPLSGLTICAVGNDVVVRKGANRWQAESGQYLLELDVSVAGESLRIVEIDTRPSGPKADKKAGLNRTVSLDAQAWFDLGLAEEERDPGKAVEAYERSRELDPRHIGARINLGRLHHEAGRLEQAERLYREALRECEPDATLFFNFGVLLEDTRRHEEAIEAYQQAIGMDPDLADAHFNLARLYEALGRPQHAIRHLGEYRRLLKS
jgi:tetratricopeptide (TPR) repeat protein